MPKPATYPDSPTVRAVAAAGGVTAVARLCRVSVPTVQAWCRLGYVADLRCGLLLGRAAGISPDGLAETLTDV